MPQKFKVLKGSPDITPPQTATGSGPIPEAGSALRAPADAPRDGTVILGAFGWPWLLPAMWCAYSETWVTANVVSERIHGKKSAGWENGTENHSSMTGWIPMPELPGVYVLHTQNAECSDPTA